MQALSRAGVPSALDWEGICSHVDLWFWQNPVPPVAGLTAQVSLLAVREATLSSAPCLGGLPPQAAQHGAPCFFKTHKGVAEALKDGAMLSGDRTLLPLYPTA